MIASPYKDIPHEKWGKVTSKLLAQHPLDGDEIVSVVRESWEQIFSSGIGPKPFKIGHDIFPKPQIMGFLLHELIPLNLGLKRPKEWRKEETAKDKDIVYIPDDQFSIELKTSSHASGIFGNRSYAQEAGSDKKVKTGYYLTVNFGKFEVHGGELRPEISLIRFGWLDHEDWLGQKSATGQQARLSPAVLAGKLVTLYSK